MAIDVGALVSAMTQAGEGLGTTVWGDMQTYAVPELEKIAQQIATIETALASIPPQLTQAGAKTLLEMQVQASVGVIVAATELTLLAVQTAINQIMSAIKGVVNGAVGFALLA